MNWWMPHIFENKRENLKTRQKIIKACRLWFEEQGFDEVQTPALQTMGAPDTHIKSFQTEGYELHTSPEIAMKKLLVAGMEKIYQICPVYRKNENTPLHSPEFTMLEWYRAGRDYIAMMDDCENLIKSLGLFEDEPFERLTVEDAFKHYADISNLSSLRRQGSLAKAAKSIGVRTIETDSFEDIFHAIMAEKIEPHLGQAKGKIRPTILYDYPAPLASLAKKKGSVAERFELYINGVELANAFSELTDPTEQKERLEEDIAKKKELYGIDTPLDEDFIAALEYGMPESAGCALGLDRLIMLACNVNNIQDVVWTTKP